MFWTESSKNIRQRGENLRQLVGPIVKGLLMAVADLKPSEIEFEVERRAKRYLQELYEPKWSEFEAK